MRTKNNTYLPISLIVQTIDTDNRDNAINTHLSVFYSRYGPEVSRASRQFPRHCDIRRRKSRLRHLRRAAAAVLPEVEVRRGRRQVSATDGRGGSGRRARRAG